MLIDVFFDTICPWCWIGKHTLENALSQFKQQVKVNYKSFFLYSNIPKAGIYEKDHLRKKYNLSDLQQEEYFHTLNSMGKEVGLEFKISSIDFIPNTIASHILINTVADEKKHEIIEKMFYEVFTKRMDVGSLDELNKFAKQNNLSIDKFHKALEDPQSEKTIMKEYLNGIQRGIKGVPFYIINNKFSFYGVRRSNIILQTLGSIQNDPASFTVLK